MILSHYLIFFLDSDFSCLITRAVGQGSDVMA